MSPLNLIVTTAAIAPDSTKSPYPLPAQPATPDLFSSTQRFSGTRFQTSFSRTHLHPIFNMHWRNTGTHTNTLQTQTSLSHLLTWNGKHHHRPMVLPSLHIIFNYLEQLTIYLTSNTSLYHADNHKPIAEISSIRTSQVLPGKSLNSIKLN